RNRRRPPRHTVDEDVDEGPLGAKDLAMEDANRIPHAAVAELLHAQPGGDGVGEGDGVLVRALRLDADADHGAAIDVEAALLDQVSIDDGVEIRVVHDVVDVAVDVVVVPARLDLQPVRELVRVHFGAPQSKALAATVTTSGETDSLS